MTTHVIGEPRGAGFESPTMGVSIVFGNGWELRLRFHDVQVTVAAPWVPINGVLGATANPSSLAHPA